MFNTVTNIDSQCIKRENIGDNFLENNEDNNLIEKNENNNNFDNKGINKDNNKDNNKDKYNDTEIKKIIDSFTEDQQIEIFKGSTYYYIYNGY